MEGLSRDVAYARGKFLPKKKECGLIISDEVVVPVAAPISVEEGSTRAPAVPERGSGNPKDIGVLG